LDNNLESKVDKTEKLKKPGKAGLSACEPDNVIKPTFVDRKCETT
jgi:hypothetical protein